MRTLFLALVLLTVPLLGRANADQPTSDFDFGALLFGAPTGDDLQTTLAVDSVGGNDANAGTLKSPKFTLPTSLVSNEKLGLYRGGCFRASLPLATGTSLNGISVRGLSLASGALPVLSALDPVANGSFTANGDGTYSYLWTPAEAITNNGYNNVYAVEVDTTTQAAMPVASRRRMTDVTTQTAAAATPGTVWIQSPGTGAGQSGSNTQWKAVVHPKDSLAPGSGSYCYEVVSRDGPAEFPTQTVNDATVSGLELIGSSSGYGSLAGPTGFVGDRLAILHGTTHNAVIGGGSLQRSVFYEAGALTGSSGPAIQLAWYTPTATGLTWNLSRCLFYANVSDRIANCLIAHTSGSTNYDRGDIADCAFLGARWSDGSLHGTGIDYVNVVQGVIDRVYVQGVAAAFGPNMPAAVEIKNSVFQQVNDTPIGSTSFHDNIVSAESLGLNFGLPVGFLFRRDGAVVTNNLFVARGVATGATGDKGAKAFSFYAGVTTGTASHNIIVVSPLGSNQAYYCDNFPSGTSGVSLDYNLVITTAPSLPTGGGRNTWADYRAGYPTLDVHSLYVDLSNDPRGLQAVFVDPANGDFRWAQTDVARQCAAYCAANHVGPAAVTSHWPVVPSVDEAVRTLSDL